MANTRATSSSDTNNGRHPNSRLAPMTWQIAFQLAISGLSIGSIYALVALALVIPFKASGVLNFAQGEMVTLGAYIGLVLSSSLPLPFGVIALLTVLIAGAFGIAIE